MESNANLVTVAAVQFCPKLKMKTENLAVCLTKLEEAARNGAILIAFPECALSGFVFEDRQEALALAETIPGPSTNQVAQKCASLHVYTVIGLIEEEGCKLYNSAAFIGPDGLIGKYRKTHLPQAGVDRFTEKGNIPYEVYNSKVGRLGIQICYDIQHPEGVRCLALNGAEIIVNITNYPEGVEFMPDFVLPTRVIENRVHLLTCDRIGVERGVRFIGKSIIIDADSQICAKANEEDIIYAQLDLSRARVKRVVTKTGASEIDLFKDRRPELYGSICQQEPNMQTIN